MRKASAVFLVAVLSISAFSAAKLHFATVWAGAGAPGQGSEESPTMYGLAASVFNQSWNDPRWISELKLSGCKWARMNVFNENRSTHFNDSLSCFELLQNESIKCLGVFCQDLNTWKVPIGNLTEWQTLVDDALNNYGQFLDAVECWNEPDLTINQEGCMNSPENYTEMLRILYNETKEYAQNNNKTINVVAGSVVSIYTNDSTPGNGTSFIQAIKDLGSDDCCDAYSMHIYKTGPGGNDSDEYLQGRTAGEAYDYIKSITDVNSTGPNPLWVSETGTHDNTDEGQASQMQTWFTELESVSCPMVFWYNYIDPDENIHGIVETGTFEERTAFQVFHAHAQLAEQLSNTYLVVRGTDSIVYYCIFNGSDWSDWSWLPIETPYAPAAAIFQGKLHIVVVGTMYNALYWGSVNLTTQEFSGWTWIPGGSDAPPSLASSADKLCLVVRGTDGIVYYKIYYGSVWSDWSWFPIETPYAPSATVLKNNLYVSVVGTMYNAIYCGSINLTTQEFSGWTWIPGGSNATPTLASSADRLCLVVRGTNSIVYYRIYDGSIWTNWSWLPIETLYSPGAAISQGRLCVAVIGPMYNAIYYGDVDLNTQEFSGWTWIPGSSSTGPRVT